VNYKDIFTLVSQAIQGLMGNQLNLFVSDGKTMFNAFVVILVLMYGARIALSPKSLNPADVMQLLVQIIIGHTCIYYYSSPLPLIGDSFTGLIIHEANFLTNQIGSTQYDTLQQAATTLVAKLPPTSMTDLVTDGTYLLFSFLVALIKAVIFLVASFGFIMQSLLLLFGPIFIPFYIVPQLDFLAWNWFKCFLQYSFYGVLGNGYAFILTSITIAVFNQIGQAISQPNANSLASLGGLLWLVVTALVGVVLIPQLVSQLFSGQSGSNALPSKP
jgi:TrbL/VirB6 plasmid conjugal transfer protein